MTARAAPILAALALAVLGCGGEQEAPPAAATPDAPAAEVQRLYEGIPQDGIRLGDPDAPATLVEIADLQCPFCAQYSVQALPTIVQDYVRPGRVAYELRLRSFLGRDSVRAAGAAAAAARADRMYQFADLFFRNQGLENSDYADADFIRAIARQVEGLDPEAIVAAADDPLAQPAVRRQEEFARAIESSGTPDFYLRRRGSKRLEPLEPRGTSPEAYARALDAALGR